MDNGSTVKEGSEVVVNLKPTFNSLRSARIEFESPLKIGASPLDVGASFCWTIRWMVPGGVVSGPLFVDAGCILWMLLVLSGFCS